MGGGVVTYRIFTNDRGRVAGVPMYSALAPLKADSMASAEAEARARWHKFGPPYNAPIKAIEWPPTSQSSKDWLAKHT